MSSTRAEAVSASPSPASFASSARTRRPRSTATGLAAVAATLALVGCAPSTDGPPAAARDAEAAASPGNSTPVDESPAVTDPGDPGDVGAAGSGAPSQGGPAQRADTVLVAEAPRSIDLPGGRTVPVRSVSTTSDGTLDVPDDIRKAGWWSGGSRLADPFGSTLIAGHIDSVTQGLGPFAELLQAESGDRVEVRSRRLVQSFVVRSLKLVPRSTVNTLPSIFGPSGGRRLVLVTCAPPYDSANGGYQNLALVTAVPESAPRKAAE